MALNNLPEDYLRVLLKSFSFLDNCNIMLFDENVSSFHRIFPLFYKIPCILVFFTTLSLHIFKIFNGYMVFDELANFASIFVFCILSFCRAVVITSKKKVIKAVILRLGCIWRTKDLSEEQIMKKNAQLKRLNFRYAVFYWIFFIGTWQYTLAPLFETLFRRFVLQQECELLLPFNCVYPFEPTQDWLTYLAVYIFQTYSMNYIIYCFVGTETILIALSSHLSIEFTLLQYDFVNLVPETNKKNCESSQRNEGQSMRYLIGRHQELIRLSKDLDDIFNVIIFVNLSGATIIISFFLVSIIVAKGALEILKNIIPIFSGSYTIYSECFHAEALKEASSLIGDSAYQNPWFKGNKEHRWATWFIMTRSQQPSCLTSLKYKKITLSTFMAVMSTTWSYFSLASSMYQDE